MPCNVCGMMYITRSFTESVVKSGTATATKDWLLYRFLSLRSIRKIRNSQLFLDNGLACTSREKKKKKELRPSLARFVGQGGTRGGKKEEEKVAKGRDSTPSTGRCHLDCHASSLFHNQRKICTTSEDLSLQKYFNICAIKLFDRNNTLQN